MSRKTLVRTTALTVLGLLVSSLPTSEAVAAVGRTEAAYGVTPNGAASYTIPIRVTEGIAGLTPKLAISYVGPGTRTILGVGTALSGISYITPCRKTIAQDLNAAPVTLTSADRYCLDGARLRLVTGTYGASGATYRTELDQMVRVTSLNSVNGIPGSFKVEMPNGIEYEYGNTADSKLLASGTSGAPPQFWAVNKIYDSNGNSIVFSYDTNQAVRRFRPNYISYTERGGSGHYRMTYVYEAGTQPEPTLNYTPSATGGAARSNDKLLERIDLSHDLTVYRKILFTYEGGAGSNKRLRAIQECVPGAPDDCLAATQLTWQSASSGHGSPVASNAVASGVISLDINKDGIQDLAWAASGTWRYMLGNFNGYVGSAVINTSVTATNASKAMPLEWNGDGFGDLLIDWSDGKWRVLTGNAGGLTTSPVQAGSGAGISSGATNVRWTVADSNNDGRDDLFYMATSPYATIAASIKLHQNSSTGFGGATTAYSTIYLRALDPGFNRLSAASAITRPDFNGDGRTDFLIFACEWDFEPPGQCLSVGWYHLLSSGATYVNQGNLVYASYPVDVRYGDFNGDGLSDVAYSAQTPGKWYLGLGQGSGGLAVKAGPTFAGYTNYLTLTGDYDGDGYDDLYAATSSSPQWHVFRGSGNGLALSPIPTGISAAGNGWILADQNGDSLADLGRYDSASFVWSSYAHLGAPGERLLSALDGLGNEVDFTYLPMTDAAVYAKGVGAIFPAQDFQSATPLVHTMTVAPAGGTSFTLTYKYKQARVHAQGRSFLGMGTREISDDRNTIFTTETHRQDFPYIGAPASVSVKQSSAPTAKTIQNIAHTYNFYTLSSASGNERYLPYRSQTITNAYEVGGLKDGALIAEVTETHTVNTSGNSTFVAVDVKDKDVLSPETGSIYRTEITSTFTENTADWCIAAPLTRNEKRILPGGTNQTRAMAWQVATAQCRVTQETVEPGGGSPLSLVTDLGYDGCGNVNSISTYPAGQSSQARTTSIDYGTRCQRPELITNPLTQTSTIGYNWPLALPSSHTDPNGIAVGMVYDGFGRLAQRDNPDGTDVTFTLTACTAGNSWCGKNSGARIKVSQLMRDTSNAAIRTDEQLLDGFGRVRWTHSDSLESGPSIVQTDYDAFGRPSAQSQPHFLGGTMYPTIYARDLIGRVTQVNAPISQIDPTGRITGLIYEGRDLKIADPKGAMTTRQSNVIGQLRAVVDPNAIDTTRYAYHPFGELASITDAALNVTSWNINVRGFTTGTTDPDSGSWTYESNAFGETERIRDANTSAPAWTTQFTFDKLSRPLTRVDLQPAGTTNFIWGTSAAAKNIGQLASINSPGGYSEVYSFDSIGRLSQQSVTADGTTYEINLTYVPATGLLETLEYPVSTSGYRLKLGYDYANGQLKRVKHISGAPVYWEAVSTDAWGHIQDENFGNGVATFTQFDQASGLMKYREGGLGGGTGLIHSLVDWDLNGNLAQRQDLKLSPNVTEDFFYDALNRFDKSERTPAGASTETNADVTLDAIGNITWKLGVGNYTYDATQKRAVTQAGSFSFDYDANGNMTIRNGASISYTSYNLPSVINAGAGYSSTLSYGAFRNRYKQIAVTPGSTETTIYVAGLLEKVTRGASIEYRHLIHGGKGAAAIHTRVVGGASSTYYLHRDHLGSPELIADSSGNEVVRPSFGAFGERRDGTDWSGPPSIADLTDIANTIRRGFTGHEHLDAVGLIHMNGRVYEPVVGRFLSADPLVRLGASQSPNRYAYVSNRPLTLIDPSGLTDDFPSCDQQGPDGTCQFPDLDGDIPDECDIYGPWAAGCSGTNRQDRWERDPFGDFDRSNSGESGSSGDGEGGNDAENDAASADPEVCTIGDFFSDLGNAIYSKAYENNFSVGLAVSAMWGNEMNGFSTRQLSIELNIPLGQYTISATKADNLSGTGLAYTLGLGTFLSYQDGPSEQGVYAEDFNHYVIAFGPGASATLASSDNGASVDHPISRGRSGLKGTFGLALANVDGNVNRYASEPLVNRSPPTFSGCGGRID